jgi:hypothetical protein
MRRVVSAVLVAAICGLACGCGEPSLPPPKPSTNWKVSPVGGPLELRPLPPANEILRDFKNWTEANHAQVARVYEATLVGSSNQQAFSIEVRRGETPMGRPEHTYVSFIYNSGTNGAYEFLWDRLGRHSGDFLKLGNQPKQVWVTFNWRASDKRMPILEIAAFEGVELGGVVIAQPGGVLK